MAGWNATGFTGNESVTTQMTALLDPGWQLVAAVQFYINYAVIGIGVVGVAANSVVLYALIVCHAQAAKKCGVNLLIITQNCINLCCCVFIVICRAVFVGNVYLTGALGYTLCAFFISNCPAYCVLTASVINLMTVTIERYLKVVYPLWSKRSLKRWMIYAVIVFSWIGGILSTAPVAFLFSVVSDGRCFAYAFFVEKSFTPKRILNLGFLSVFVIPLVIFVYCYGHIVFMTRKQMRVMAGHNVEGSSAQSSSQVQSERAKWNVIKTMIIVSAFFAICYFPVNIYYLIVGDSTPSHHLVMGYYIVLFLPYVNISLNPFIYATKHEEVRQILTSMVICQKRGDLSSVAGTQSMPQ